MIIECENCAICGKLIELGADYAVQIKDKYICENCFVDEDTDYDCFELIKNNIPSFSIASHPDSFYYDGKWIGDIDTLCVSDIIDYLTELGDVHIHTRKDIKETDKTFYRISIANGKNRR